MAFIATSRKDKKTAKNSRFFYVCYIINTITNQGLLNKKMTSDINKTLNTR